MPIDKLVFGLLIFATAVLILWVLWWLLSSAIKDQDKAIDERKDNLFQ